jgi:polar amino acid transport system substrate-binding protein
MCTLCVGFLGASEQNTKILLLTHNLKPYSYVDDEGELTGRAVKVVKCAFDRINYKAAIEVVPWARAQNMVQNDRADGFFAASQQPARDEYAQLSHPIADQNWVWFWPVQSNITANNVLATKDFVRSSFHGANMQIWIEARDYQVLSILPETTEQLVRMVLAGRIEVGMANQSVLESILTVNGNRDLFELVVAQEKPLGIYIRKNWLADHPNFMSILNSAIDGCRVPSITTR